MYNTGLTFYKRVCYFLGNGRRLSRVNILGWVKSVDLIDNIVVWLMSLFRLGHQPFKSGFRFSVYGNLYLCFGMNFVYVSSAIKILFYNSILYEEAWLYWGTEIYFILCLHMVGECGGVFLGSAQVGKDSISIYKDLI